MDERCIEKLSEGVVLGKILDIVNVSERYRVVRVCELSSGNIVELSDSRPGNKFVVDTMIGKIAKLYYSQVRGTYVKQDDAVGKIFVNIDKIELYNTPTKKIKVMIEIDDTFRTPPEIEQRVSKNLIQATLTNLDSGDTCTTEERHEVWKFLAIQEIKQPVRRYDG